MHQLNDHQMHLIQQDDIHNVLQLYELKLSIKYISISNIINNKKEKKIFKLYITFPVPGGPVKSITYINH